MTLDTTTLAGAAPLLIALAVAIAVVLGVLALVLRAGSRPAAGARDDARQAPPPSAADLRWGFRRAMDRLGLLRLRGVERERLPWIVVLDEGPQGTALPLPDAPAAPSDGRDGGGGGDGAGVVEEAGLRWRRTGASLVVQFLDAGAHDERRVDARWDQLLASCADHRPHRPLDAIVVTVPAAVLVDGEVETREALWRMAARTRRRLWAAQHRCAMRFAVYVVVEGCEAIPGFVSLAQALPPHRRDEMLGWSSPHDPSTLWQPRRVDEALEQTARAVVGAGAELCAGPAGGALDPDLFQLPGRILALRPRLRTYCDELMRPQGEDEPFVVRGLYLCADAGGPGVVAPAFVADLFERKVCAETGLSRPSTTQALARGRRSPVLTATAWGLLAAWALALAGTTVALGRQAQALEQALVRLQQDADTQAAAARQGRAMPATWQRDRAIELLRLMERIDQQRLWTVVMPGSWPVFDGLSARVRERLEHAFSDLAVTTLRRGLYDRTARLTGVAQDDATGEPISGAPCHDGSTAAGVDPANAPSLGVEDLPAFARLLSFVAEAEQIDRGTQAMHRLLDAAQPADGRDLVALVRVALGVDLPGRLDRAAGVFRSRSAIAGGPGRTAMRLALDCSLDRLVAELGRQAFEHNPMLQAQREFEHRLAPLGGGDAPDDPLLAWRELRQQLETLDALLTRGGGAWMARTSFQPGPAWDPLLARIGAVGLLGHDAVRRVREQTEAGHRRLRGDLEAETGEALPLSVAWDEADGRWVAGPHAIDLHDALKALFGQPWMNRSVGTLHLEGAADPRVGWDLARLDQALAVADLRKHFEAELLPRFPPDLHEAIQPAVHAQLAALVVHHVASAMAPGARTLGLDAFAYEAERGRLGRLQALLAELGARPAAQQIRAVQQRDAFARLQALDEALERAELYQPRPGGFAAWNGERGPVLAAFALPDAAALVAYLGQQRGRLEALGRDAELLLSTLGPAVPGAVSVDRWHAIVRDLDRYRLCNPASSLLALENHLIAMAGDVDVGNCADRAAAALAPQRGGDLLSVRHQQLAVALQQRCAELRSRDQQDAWERFAALYNRSFATRAPFVPGGWGADAPAVDAPELARLLRAWDGHARALRDVAADTRRPPAVRRFLEQMDRIRAFMAPSVAAEDGSIPGYDLLVEFRVRQADESQGNKVIDWQLTSGAQQIGSRDAPRPLRWVPGDPIALTWRLAKDGPALPRPDERQPALQVQGHAATLAYTDPWALFNLLARHREPDPVRAADPRQGQLLRFEFPLALQGDDADAARARLFLRLTVQPAGKRAPLAWPGPMPAQAPDPAP